eukprot:CAMPEP_0198284360 /NCGR_PEP_ID=MMETSP1449-20131203/3837_1 /TAXON_ID=420275 /ORGANISM="Attheya septentrionalis, Strain CCMP2084" /LENGTH=917 /DNA_ID=CAMNT_0043981389 /DNA_START=103 /DNA_END=2856 /DNA_ORIENTATION=+
MGTRKLDDGEVSCENPTCGSRWAEMVHKIRYPVVRVVLAITRHAATHPRAYVVGTLLLSFSTVILGLFTNFQVDTNQDVLWSPVNSYPVKHNDWMNDESGFPEQPRDFFITIHANGANVLSKEGVSRVFEALQTVQSTVGYDDLCALTELAQQKEQTENQAPRTCKVSSVSQFWGDDLSLFNSTIFTDQDAISALSSPFFSDGRPVDRKRVFGLAQPQLPIFENAIEEGGNIFSEEILLTSAVSYPCVIKLPRTTGTKAEDFEEIAIAKMLKLRDTWESQEGNIFRLELFADRSFDDEFGRSIIKDIPLLPLVFLIMTIFCCFVFANFKNPVLSQALLGFGAVVTVLLSILTGYGLMFIIGVPFTSLTQIFPFIMFGVGLDDAFVISGAFNRTSNKKDSVERMMEAMEDVGSSVIMTTLTTSAAFALGCTSTIPAVYWLCLYAFPCVLIDFLYQITFFTALLVIDAHRIKANKLDCVVCCRSSRSGSEEDIQQREIPERSKTFTENLMGRYCDFLMKPWVKVFVLISFTAMLGGFAYSTSQLEQFFDYRDLLPNGSYVASFFDTLNDYAEDLAFQPEVFFRDVDVSDPEVQASMNKYLSDLTTLDSITELPSFFWLQDFTAFETTNQAALAGMTFEEKLTEFLADPVFFSLYANDIVRDPNTGVVTASRTKVIMDNVDGLDVRNQVKTIKDQRAMTKRQPINEGLGKGNWHFFTFLDLYFIWDFYAVAVEELILSTVLGVVAVVIISLIFIPHWSGSIFVTLLVSMLYIDLLGFAQVAGLHINSVTYIGLVMSIGLMVDYVMHIVVTYFESSAPTREGKVCETLETIGVSILIGGTSTFLGVVPLAFSSSDVFWTIFIIFLGLVILGVGNGLILLPVLLSIVGPLENVTKKAKFLDSESDQEKDEHWAEHGSEIGDA